MAFLKQHCPPKIPCEPAVIAKKTLSGGDSWSLVEFFGDGIGTPFACWQIVQTNGDDYIHGIDVFFGKIGEQGELRLADGRRLSETGFDNIATTCEYPIDLELQQGCPDLCECGPCITYENCFACQWIEQTEETNV